MASYSIIIKNGVIFDGSEKPPQKNDIGIVNDRIKAIGNLQKESGEMIIDASAKYVCPGFIDLTTHSDTHWTIFSQPSQESFIRQGITTILGGHGGYSLAPLTRAEDIDVIRKWTDVSKINIDWQTVKEFLNKLSNQAIALNFGTLVGHGTIRRNIIGNASNGNSARKEQIVQMQILAEQAIKDGVFGISTNLGSIDEGEANDDEIIEIFKIAKKHNIFTSHHLEDEGRNILPAIARLIAITRKSEAASHISHLKAIGKTAWQYFPQGLDIIKKANKEGLKITCDFFPYTRTGSNLETLLPDWLRESKNKNAFNLIDGDEHKHLLDYIKGLTLHYENIIIASTLHDLDSVGKSIARISQESGINPEEIIVNLLKLNNYRVSIFNEAIFQENIELLAQKTYSVFSSDGVGYANNGKTPTDLPHPRSFGAFPRALAQFVRNNQILNWENAIYKMTGLPAKIADIKNRGVIAESAYADIVIFDPNTIQDKADYSNPRAFPEGIDYVLINGGIALDGNHLINAKQGRVLRHS